MSEALAMDEQITLQLTVAEALILSDCIDRLNTDQRVTGLMDKSEQMALWALDCVLEQWNPVIFSADYAKHLQEAKSHITRGTDE